MRTRQWVTLVAAGVVALTGCGDSDHETSSDSTVNASSPVTTAIATTAVAAPETTVAAETTVATETTAAAPSGGSDTEALFHDPLDDDTNAWGVVEHPEFGSAQFVDGDYVWDFSGSVAHWLPGVLGEQYDRGELEFNDVVVHADLTIDLGGGVAGVFCREQPDSDAEWQWYEFVVRDGFAAIRLADSEANIEVLTETTDVDLPLGTPIALDATCVDDVDGEAHLSLAVNGADLLEVAVDDPLGNGVAGMQAWTFPIHDPLAVRWHEFSVARAAL